MHDISRLPHLVAGRERLENLWAAGTDYSTDIVEAARVQNAMLHLDLDLTGECKLNCFYCDRTPDRFNDVPNRIEITTHERCELVSQARALGATTVEFPGAGEPMIDPGFWDIVEFVHNLGMTTVLFTSGYHLNENAVDRLFNLGTTVFLKQNSMSSAVQDKMVGVRGYGIKAQRALKLLMERGFNKTIPTRLAVDMVVTPQFNESADFAEVVEMHRWCRENNIHNYIVTLIPEGRADKQAMLLERERTNRMIQAVQKVDEQEFGLTYEPSRPMAGGYRCRQVNVGLFVNLFGEVYDCNGLGRFLGHIRRDSLETIWNSKFSRHVRAPVQDGFCLLRERVWDDGDALSGLERKVQLYRLYKATKGDDPVVTGGLEFAMNPKPKPEDGT
ncbi:radical SAM/SPASM domain-containing protein [Hoeflea poritis]|uniref:Radical SAM protein n=1 Tax=Hoeflea poritis TaxID=2993659 RepID=A0ABT4VKL2_9HYPH|nr:radical SAM protein [Hoeflea poritis]MDA4845240.1 radical SAM protein [Hoeflea poritis]